MKRKSATPASKKAPARPAELDSVIEAIDVDSGDERIVARPDGYHWLAPDGKREFGPFATIEQAQADMEATDEGLEADSGAALLEAENEIGIADWIDPDTGEPAEGQSTPHLDEE